MMVLTEDQRRTLEKGEPVRAMVGGKEMVLLQGQVYRTILGIRKVDKAVIASGHTRGPIPVPEALEDPELGNLPGDGQDIAILRADKFDEIKECAEDAQVQRAWRDAVHRAQRQWAEENPFET